MFLNYYWDTIGMFFMLPVLLFALLAQSRVTNTYQKYNLVRTSKGMTGAEVARTILDGAGLRHVRIEMVEGRLSDHYDPRSQVVRLSRNVYGSATISSAGIAAHECGHAIQHAEGYGPLQARNAIIPLTNLGSSLAVPLIMIGFLMDSSAFITIGILGYSLVALFQLITLPVEYNASSRALQIMETSYILHDGELAGAKKVLNAAALTYVAALASAVAQLLRLFLLTKNRREK